VAYRGIEVSYGRLAAEMDDQASDSGLKARAARYARYAPELGWEMAHRAGFEPTTPRFV